MISMAGGRGAAPESIPGLGLRCAPACTETVSFRGRGVLPYAVYLPYSNHKKFVRNGKYGISTISDKSL